MTKQRILYLILIVATFIRLTTLQNLMVFTPDEEYLAYIAQTIVKHFHIIWIGVSALGLDFYMGPFWIYAIYPFIGLTRGNPLVLGVISSSLGLLTILLIYLVGKTIFDSKVGILAAFMYATSALIVYYDQQPYPSGVPLLSLILIFSLIKTKASNKWWLLFAFAYGLVFHVHLSLFLVGFVSLYWIILNRKPLEQKIILASVLVFIITISPLIAFDYFHKASNITVPIRILRSIKEGGKPTNLKYRSLVLLGSFSRLLYLDSHKNNADEILYPCNVKEESTATHINWVFSGLVFSAIAMFLTKKSIWNDHSRRGLLLYCLTFLIPFLFLPVINSVEYYLLGFFPILFLIIAYVSINLKKPLNYLAILLITAFALHGIYVVFTARGDFGVHTKQKIITETMSIIGNEPYYLEEKGNCHEAEGWRYLFSYYERRPERSSEDKIFAWLYPKEVSDKATRFSVILKETRSQANIDQGYIYRFEEGGFTAYIYKN
ncbi:glycosyltransferase family 39 protein [Candidatus Woesebacteria bacterium]|nr:glycosyltransferase family 39 protein [Candidatus Woesebacteria bacterium]